MQEFVSHSICHKLFIIGVEQGASARCWGNVSCSFRISATETTSQNILSTISGHSKDARAVASLVSVHLTGNLGLYPDPKKEDGMAKPLMVFVYGLVSYIAFFLTFVYAVGFIGNLYVPNSMDSAARIS